MERFTFSREISDFIEELKEDFENSKPEDPIQWFKDALKRHCLVKEEDVEKVTEELLSGIIQYKKIKQVIDPLEVLKDKITEEEKKALMDEVKLIKARIIEEEVQNGK